MSRDLIIFDPTDLDGMTGERPAIMDAINRYMADNEPPLDAPEPEPTEAIRRFLDEVGDSYLGAYFGGGGRYCNLNQPDRGGWENTIISYSEAARATGVILIDPQGNEPLMSTPGGEGLLDF